MAARTPRKRVAIYARVSTRDQTCENQLKALRAAARRHRWKVVEEYVEHGISGAKGRDKRPALDALWQAIGRREFDMVACWSLDRLGRSTAHLVELDTHLQDKGIDLYVDRMGIDTSTAAGRFFFTVLSGLAEFERELIRERVNAGLARAAAQGRKGGRPKLPASVRRKVLKLIASGRSHRQTAAAAGVGLSTVTRLVNEQRAAAG